MKCNAPCRIYEFVDDLSVQRYFLLNETLVSGMLDIITYILQIMESSLEATYGNNFKYLNAIYFDAEGVEEITNYETSASFSNLLHTITIPDREFSEKDLTLIDSLLASYHRITSGGFELLSAFKARERNAIEDTRQFVRKKLIEIIRTWIEKYWDNFIRDGLNFCNFAILYLMHFPGGLACGLVDQIKRQALAMEKVQLTLTGAESPVILFNVSQQLVPIKIFLSWSSLEVACQLSCISGKIYSSLTYFDTINFDENTITPTAKSCMDWHQFLISWVENLVLFTSEMESRCKVIYKLLEIGSLCYSHFGNFDAFHGIHMGFRSPWLTRLTWTTEKLPEFNPGEDGELSGKFPISLQELHSITPNLHSTFLDSMQELMKSEGNRFVPWTMNYFKIIRFLNQTNTDRVRGNISLFKLKSLLFYSNSILQHSRSPGWNLSNIGHEDKKLCDLILGLNTSDSVELSDVSFYQQPPSRALEEEEEAIEKPNLLVRFESDSYVTEYTSLHHC